MPKRKFVMLTDSACDLPPELEEKCGVDIMNFEITVDGKSYTERDDFTFDEYYDILRECEGVPCTAHITMPRFLERFIEYHEEGVQDVIYVCINADGSSTYNASLMAKQAFENEYPGSGLTIHVVNSYTYSMAYGWFVAEAARKLTNGAEVSNVIGWLEDVFSRVEIVLAAYSLRFMKKSGRVSAAAAFAGELLGLRPVITLIDGESKVRKKVRGDKEVLPALIEYAEAQMDDTKQYGIGGTNQENMDALAALCRKKWKENPLAVFKLGAAVSTNTGPDAIAIVYLGKKRNHS